MDQKIEYLSEAERLIKGLGTATDTIRQAAVRSADAIERGGWVRLFGSGHSILPVMDTFPRYGGFVGFEPMMDPRLMWTAVSGPGGAEELLWLERQEGYVDNFLRHQSWSRQDVLVVISHGGQNAAPVEVALRAKESGLYVVAITSSDNHRNKPASHSTGQKIGDIADLTIDNCVSGEDAVINVPGVAGKVGGLSTLSAIALMQGLVSETAKVLANRGIHVKPFASPNAEGVESDRNEQVYVDYRNRMAAAPGDLETDK